MLTPPPGFISPPLTSSSFPCSANEALREPGGEQTHPDGSGRGAQKPRLPLHRAVLRDLHHQCELGGGSPPSVPPSVPPSLPAPPPWVLGLGFVPPPPLAPPSPGGGCSRLIGVWLLSALGLSAPSCVVPIPEVAPKRGLHPSGGREGVPIHIIASRGAPIHLMDPRGVSIPVVAPKRGPHPHGGRGGGPHPSGGPKEGLHPRGARGGVPIHIIAPSAVPSIWWLLRGVPIYLMDPRGSPSQW